MSEMKTVEEYLRRVRLAMAGSDPALIQDALFDAHEFLASERAETGSRDEGSLLESAIAQFGTPEEVAAAYRGTEENVRRALALPAPAAGAGFVQRLFGVLIDPRAIGALAYLLLSLPWAVFAFVWSVTGLAIGLSLSIVWIGLPILAAFFSSLSGLALIEGRIIEALVGIRMPRRPSAGLRPSGIWERVRVGLTRGRNWATLLYFVIRLPLAVLEFTLATVAMSLSASFIALPLVQPFFEFPLIQLPELGLWVPWWSFVVLWPIGLGFAMVALHLARGLCRFQGHVAKSMLVERES